MDTGKATAAHLLVLYAAAIGRHDWSALRALLADDAQMHYVHTDERLDPDALVALVRDYPGEWTYVAGEVVDGGDRAVLHSRTVIGDEVSHCATFASTNGSRLTDLVEIWTEAVTPHPHRRST